MTILPSVTDVSLTVNSGVSESNTPQRTITPEEKRIPVRAIRISSINNPLVYPYGSFTGVPVIEIVIDSSDPHFMQDGISYMTAREIYDTILYFTQPARVITICCDVFYLYEQPLVDLIMKFNNAAYTVNAQTTNSVPIRPFSSILWKTVLILTDEVHVSSVNRLLRYTDKPEDIEIIIPLTDSKSVDFAAELVYMTKEFHEFPQIYIMPKASLVGKSNLQNYIQAYTLGIGIICNDIRFASSNVHVSWNPAALFNREY